MSLIAIYRSQFVKIKLITKVLINSLFGSWFYSKVNPVSTSVLVKEFSATVKVREEYFVSWLTFCLRMFSRLWGVCNIS